MGTPHLGSRKADWARPITQLSSLLRKTNKDIIAVLEPGSEMLANLQQEFHTMLEDRRRNEGKWIEIFCFYEELAYPGIGDIVPRQSAILPEYPNASIHQNHSDMTKFGGATDAGYVRVRGQLWLWVNTINEKPASQANTSEPQPTSAPQEISELEQPRKDQQQTRKREQTQEIEASGRGGISSGGGPIFMGNVSAGRDFTYTQQST